VTAFERAPSVESGSHDPKGDSMYIGGGLLALILIILLLIWIF
jgi:flagellar biogenesis protein FliO